jgi:hypothetical protein
MSDCYEHRHSCRIIQGKSLVADCPCHRQRGKHKVRVLPPMRSCQGYELCRAIMLPVMLDHRESKSYASGRLWSTDRLPCEQQRGIQGDALSLVRASPTKEQYSHFD